MRGGALKRTAFLIALLLLASADPAAAHLRKVGSSFVELVTSSDAIVVARALEPTEDRAGSAKKTSFFALEAIAGPAPAGEFEVRAGEPPLRYAKGQRAFVLIARDGESWRSVQPAGMAFLIENETPDAATKHLFARLWQATRDEPRPQELGDILRPALRSPHRKIRLMAALDLSELVDHAQPPPDGLIEALRADLADSTIDPVVRPTLSKALADAARRAPAEPKPSP